MPARWSPLDPQPLIDLLAYRLNKPVDEISSRDVAAFGHRHSTLFGLWRVTGVPPIQADRFAIALGVHPAYLWGSLWTACAPDEVFEEETLF